MSQINHGTGTFAVEVDGVEHVDCTMEEAFAIGNTAVVATYRCRSANSPAGMWSAPMDRAKFEATFDLRPISKAEFKRRTEALRKVRSEREYFATFIADRVLEGHTPDAAQVRLYGEISSRYIDARDRWQEAHNIAEAEAVARSNAWREQQAELRSGAGR